MGWIRANRRGVGALALLALAFQLAVALGHVHAPGAAPVAQAIIAAQGNTTFPTDDGLPVRQSDANCDICAVLHMAAVGEVAAAPSLALPFAFVMAPRVVVAETILTSPRHRLAQSRAPPAV